MSQLHEELTRELIAALNLEDLKPEDIGDDTPLWGEGLGLDSIDALEVTILLERKYGCKIASPEQGREVLATIASMASFVVANRTK